MTTTGVAASSLDTRPLAAKVRCLTDTPYAPPVQACLGTGWTEGTEGVGEGRSAAGEGPKTEGGGKAAETTVARANGRGSSGRGSTGGSAVGAPSSHAAMSLPSMRRGARRGCHPRPPGRRPPSVEPQPLPSWRWSVRPAAAATPPMVVAAIPIQQAAGVTAARRRPWLQCSGNLGDAQGSRRGGGWPAGRVAAASAGLVAGRPRR